MNVCNKKIVLSSAALMILAGCVSSPEGVEKDIGILMNSVSSNDALMKTYCASNRQGMVDLVTKELTKLAKADQLKSGFTSYNEIGNGAGRRLASLC
jgi:starvation-inducible outer membrane lipoprotein